MHFDPETSYFFFTRPERHMMGIGQDVAFPLWAAEDLLDEALSRREDLVSVDGPEEDLQLVENLIIELTGLQEQFEETVAPPVVGCEKTRFTGCVALLPDPTPFEYRQNIRRHEDVYRGYF